MSIRPILIVQPWFVGIGHPAQSLLNTATALDGAVSPDYMIAVARGKNSFEHLRSKLERFGSVHSFTVLTSSVREGTLRALLNLTQLSASGIKYDCVFFLDGHLVTLAFLWPVISKFVSARRLGLVYLAGPERVSQFWLVRSVVRRLIARDDIKVYFRTEELASAWRSSFNTVPSANLVFLPSLEIPDTDTSYVSPLPSDHLRFAVLGQIRRGKSLELLVPLFTASPQIGQLTIAGAFNHGADRRSLIGVLGRFGGFHEGFMAEEEMLALAMSHDYLLVLYDIWDGRMESAVLYLAARANRPVVTYEGGWCARMVRTYGNGVVIRKDRDRVGEALQALPRPGTFEYQKLVVGVGSFREAHSIARLRPHFLKSLLG